MKGTLLYAPGDVRFESVSDPRIVKPTDAIIELSATCICGSDLWPFRGLNDVTHGRAIMQIKRSGSRPSQKGPGGWFTGQVRIDPLHAAEPPSRTGAGLVTFEPGARTAWHTHPLGQTLIIVSGAGWVQSEGGPIEDVKPGDVVWFPAGLKHWHGATPETAMSHIAITEQLDGKAVDWLEKVTDQQFAK